MLRPVSIPKGRISVSTKILGDWKSDPKEAAFIVCVYIPLSKGSLGYGHLYLLPLH